MRIAYFISNRSTFPADKNSINASTTVVTNIIKHLYKKHDITLYAAQGSKMEGIRIIDLSLPAFKIDSAVEAVDWATKAVLGMKGIYTGELFKNAGRYDIIHLNTEPVYLGFPYAKLLKTPVLFTSHNAFHDLEKSIFSFFDKKIYLSALSQNQVKTFPMTQKIPVVHNGIEIEKFPFEENSDNYFLFMGRLVKDKGIDAFLELARKNKDKLFYIVGMGEPFYEAFISKEVKENPNIKFFGMVPRETDSWFKLLSKAKALIAPANFEEPFGLVMAEAMATGTPVVAFSKGSAPEIVLDGKTGFLVNASNDIRGDWIIKETGIEGLNLAIKTILDTPSQAYVQMRKAARNNVETNFNDKKMASEYEKLYFSIVSDFKSKNSNNK